MARITPSLLAEAFSIRSLNTKSGIIIDHFPLKKDYFSFVKIKSPNFFGATFM